MQKKLIALAIAGLSSTAAFAQTNVTLYGVADATYDNVSASGGTAGTGAGEYKSFSRVNSNSSYIGLKGTEDLGDGLKAVFQFETGFNNDTGAYSGSGRDTYVGLSGSFGTIVTGNITGPTRAIGTSFELIPGRTGIGTLDSILGQPITRTGATAGTVGSAGDGIFDTRLANTIAYISPSFNGVTAVLGYSATLAEAQTNKATAAGSQFNSGKAYDLGLNYDNGPWAVKFAYGKADTGSDSSLASSNTLHTLKDMRLGAGYTFEAGHKINVVWDRQKYEYSNVEAERNAYVIEGLFKVTPAGSLIGTYARAADISGNLLASNADTGARMLTVGYLQALSKRTTLKAIYSRITNDNNAQYNFATNGVGTIADGVDPRGLSLGIRHSF